MLNNEILTAKELSRKFKLPLPSIYYMVNKGQIPYFKIIGRLRFKENDVLAHFTKESSGKEIQ